MSIISKHLPILAATSLASLSLSNGDELRQIAKTSAPTTTIEQAKGYQKLGVFGDTTFYLRTEGVRKYLVAENQGDIAETLCQSVNVGAFFVSDYKGAPGICRISLGPDQYSYIAFGGGRISKL
jgi:hypothetical protein